MLESQLINPTISRGNHVVLVVDDDPATRYVTARILSSAGFQTREAATGAEGLAQADSVSAIVLDVHLPDMDGFEVCRRIRAQPALALLPIMHVSAAHIRDEDKVTGLDSGGDAYLVRPVEPAVLVATLQALIRARLAEDQLRRSEARFRAIYSHATSGIALIDAQGRFADVNPALSALVGRTPAALVGVKVEDLVPREWTALVREQLAPTDDSPSPWQGEFPLRRPDGSLVYLDWSLSAHVEPGLRIGIALDATERRQLAQRRQDLLEREQAARMSAEHHSRTKDDFIAVLSHELRTPLNAIVGWIHILTRRGGTPELLKGLEAIDRNVKTQVRIISDILDVSRITSGKMRLQREMADPAELVTSSIHALEASIRNKRLSVQTDLSNATRPGWLDPARFQQIFWNLMTNAIKFSHPGGIIHIWLACDGQQLTLVVQDDGEGIRTEFLGQLFNRFSQSTSPGNRTHGGLGLGLSIVKHLVDLHGGDVQVQSEGPGRGTLMRIVLPVSLPGEAQAPGADFADSEPAPLGAEHSLQGLDVLVVEDNADASEMLGVVLADRGAQVRFATDFQSAVDAANTRWPDVLISDVGLPGRDGYELMRQIRMMEPPGRSHLPAVALTAFTRPEDRARALAAGFDQHLGKPLTPHALLETVTQLLLR